MKHDPMIRFNAVWYRIETLKTGEKVGNDGKNIMPLPELLNKMSHELDKRIIRR